eukprot:933658-Pleurochrysis_carterae.AAC.3
MECTGCCTRQDEKLERHHGDITPRAHSPTCYDLRCWWLLRRPHTRQGRGGWWGRAQGPAPVRKAPWRLGGSSQTGQPRAWIDRRAWSGHAHAWGQAKRWPTRVYSQNGPLPTPCNHAHARQPVSTGKLRT